jgi:hypothetical protein
MNHPLFRFFSSLRLSVALLILLALLTWFGTLEQVDTGLYEVQRKYFESLWLVHDVGAVPIPLPGGMLVMSVLAVNLLLGGMIRLRKGRATVGVFITHIGIALLLIAGLVKTKFAEDGHVTLYEGERANSFESYQLWQLAVVEDLGGGRVREVVAPEAAFTHATGAEPLRYAPSTLPFDLELRLYQPNCRVLPKGPMFTPALPVVDGCFLEAQPRDAQAEQNTAGIYATVVERPSGVRHEGILWGVQTQPWTVTVGGRRYGFELRRERYAMPFTLQLSKFTKEDHPRIDMAKAFSSDVVVAEGGSQRPIKISMNEPLRSGGLVVYQSSWGPSNARPGDPLFSTLAVVSNPADQYPLYACIVIAIGLVLHFSRKLYLHIRSEARR